MAEKTGKYKYVGMHVGDLDSGQTLEVGQEVDLTSDDAKAPLAALMIEEGTLIPVAEPEKSTKTTKKQGEEG